jgi:hypothetical protein
MFLFERRIVKKISNQECVLRKVGVDEPLRFLSGPLFLLSFMCLIKNFTHEI